MRPLILCLLLALGAAAFDLDAELERIEKLPPRERYAAMNRLKKELMKMTEKRREKILGRLMKRYRVAPDSQIRTPNLP